MEDESKNKDEMEAMVINLVMNNKLKMDIPSSKYHCPNNSISIISKTNKTYKIDKMKT